jgi:hypothetical protein
VKHFQKIIADETPLQGVIISALKARTQREIGEKSRVVTESIDDQTLQREQSMDFFDGMTLPGLPLSEGVSYTINRGKSKTIATNTLEVHRRQVGPRRLCL